MQIITSPVTPAQATCPLTVTRTHASAAGHEAAVASHKCTTAGMQRMRHPTVHTCARKERKKERRRRAVPSSTLVASQRQRSCLPACRKDCALPASTLQSAQKCVPCSDAYARIARRRSICQHKPYHTATSPHVHSNCKSVFFSFSFCHRVSATALLSVLQQQRRISSLQRCSCTSTIVHKHL